MALTDPMNFELLRDAIEALLIANQGSLFRTIGDQKQSINAEQVKGNLRTVQVFYSEGKYPKEKGSHQQLTHETTFQLIYTVSSPVKVDLSVLNDPDSTAGQKQAALLALNEGSRLADRLMDELRRIVTQIIMDPANRDLGLAPYVVSNRWLDNFRKSEPLDKGNLFLLTGSETLTAVVDEELIGVTPTLAVRPTVDLTSSQELIETENDQVDKPKVGFETAQ